jgi:oligo-1,6-glucosidase
LDKGVDGFRMDVIPLLSKDTTFADYPPERKNDLTYYANGPRIHEFLQEMNQEVMQHYDCLTVGEGFGVSAQQANLYVGKDRKELNMIYHFDHAVPRDEICFIEPKTEFNLVELKNIFSNWDKAIDTQGWQNTYFGNHDNPRMLSRFGDTEKYRVESAKMLATVLMTLRGTPSIYQGDEIGMSNCHFENVAEFDDVQIKNAYQSLVNEKGHDKNVFLQSANKIARDHARTPFQWNGKAQAGFSENPKTWLKINENYKEVNVQNAIENTDSIWHYYKNLIQLRREHKTLITGKFTDLLPTHQQVYAYTREAENIHFLVLTNFSTEHITVDIPLQINNLEVVISNYVDNLYPKNNKFSLRPFEAVICKFDIKY